MKKSTRYISVVALMLAMAFPAITAEKHPRIHAALDSLEHAKAELKAAPHDFGGHRAEAIEAIDHAIAQLKICERY